MRLSKRMANEIQFGFLAALAAGFVVFLSMIFMVFDMSGAAFLLSLMFLSGMMVFASVAMGGAYRGRRWGWLLVMFMCLITLLFAYVIYLLQGVMEYHTVLLAAATILFVLSIINAGISDNGNSSNNQKPKVKVYQSMDKVEPYYEAKATAKAPAKKTKGRFVASKMASHYHTVRCEWTPNIKRRNRIYFANEASAKRAKFKPHECIK
jgi:hypothetical protein